MLFFFFFFFFSKSEEREREESKTIMFLNVVVLLLFFCAAFWWGFRCVWFLTQTEEAKSRNKRERKSFFLVLEQGNKKSFTAKTGHTFSSRHKQVNSSSSLSAFTYCFLLYSLKSRAETFYYSAKTIRISIKAQFTERPPRRREREKNLARSL